jgi:DNA-directed RNA polymerase specialized sigma24 family protein
LDEIIDPTGKEMEDLWDKELQLSILEAAMAKVKRDLDPTYYQVFDLYVNKEWEPARIAKTFGIAVGLVYLMKHRVSKGIGEEVERLKTALP